MDLQKLMYSVNCEHSQRVSAISEMMAYKAGYSRNESRIISQTALFHDFGKSEIPAYILNKPSELTPEEYEIAKTHTTLGYNKLNEASQILALAATIAKQHHEYVDGNGYHGLNGNEIHPYSKIVACADVFDALKSRRIYKEPWNTQEIRKYFNEQSGKHFDPTMVFVLFNIMDNVLSLYER